jgi:magnesium transporter
MIALYRWHSGQRRGAWQEIPTLPDDGVVPAGEIWWLDLEDPSPEEEELVLKKFLRLHPLTQEDCTRPRREDSTIPHFPKVEEFPEYLFLIANPLQTTPEERQTPCANVQLSTILTPNLLVTHHYQVLPAVNAVKQYLYRHGEQVSRGPDYLLHLILDNMVDEYAPEMDRIADRLDEIETDVFRYPTHELLAELIALKRRVWTLRKTLILEREVLARLIRAEFELVEEREIAYYRNVYDHLVRYTELIEGAREMVSDLMRSHLSAVSNKLNGVMKALGMISTVILPMTLISSIYGMNFKYMPELEWSLGYPLAILLMVGAAVFAVSLFYWKRWF